MKIVFLSTQFQAWLCGLSAFEYSFGQPHVIVLLGKPCDTSNPQDGFFYPILTLKITVKPV